MQNPRQDKPKDRPTPHIDAAHRDTVRLKRESDVAHNEYKALRSQRVRGEGGPDTDVKAVAAFTRAVAKDDTLRTIRKTGKKPSSR